MSQPARAASAALRQVEASLKGVDGVTRKVEARKLSFAARMVQESRRASAGISEFGNDIMNSIGGAIGSASLAAGAAAGALALVGSKMAIDAVTFRENTTIAFKALLGSQKAAEGLYEKVLDVADRVGLEKEQAVASIKKLISAGFDEAGAVSVLEAIANTSAVLGEGAAGKLENFFTVLKATGKADLDTLKKTGINLENVYGRLAKTMGKTVDQVKALEKAGKLDAAAVTKAITDEVNKGDIGEALGNSFDRLFGDVVGKVKRLFDKVDIGPIKEALKGVLAALDGPGGKKIREGINKIFGGLFDALFGGFDAGRIDAIIGVIGDALNIIGDVILAIAPSVKVFFGAMIDGLIFVWPLFKAIGGAVVAVFAKLQQWGVLEPILKGIGYALVIIAAAMAVGAVAATLLLLPLYLLIAVIALVVYAIVELVSWIAGGLSGAGAAFMAALGAIWEALSAFGSAVWEAVSGIAAAIWDGLSAAASAVWSFITQFVEAANSIGGAIIEGIINGLSAGIGWIISAVTGLGSTIISTVKSVLKIGSPSKVFEGLGAFTAEGFAAGVENDNAAPQAVQAMVAPPTAMSSEDAGRAAAGGKSGGGRGDVHIELNITAPSGDAEDIGSTVRRELEMVFEQLDYAS